MNVKYAWFQVCFNYNIKKIKLLNILQFSKLFCVSRRYSLSFFLKLKSNLYHTLILWNLEHSLGTFHLRCHTDHPNSFDDRVLNSYLRNSSNSNNLWKDTYISNENDLFKQCWISNTMFFLNSFSIYNLFKLDFK